MNQKNVVLVGGGHCHALVLKQLQAQPIENISLTVIDPGEKAPYTGMLPGYVAGHYSRDELYLDIKGLCEKVGAAFIKGRVIDADPHKNTVTLQSGETIDYDVVSYDIGIHARLFTVRGFEHAVPIKPLGDFAQAWRTYQDNNIQKKRVVVIGGGVAGVETAFAIQHALRDKDSRVDIVEHGDLLQRVSSSTKSFLQKELKKKKVVVHEHSIVDSIDETKVVLSNKKVIPSDFTVTAAGARPHKWLSDTQIPLVDGYISVNHFLQNSEYNNIFAVGDCAHFEPYPLEKAGVYAVRQAPFLYSNIDGFINNKKMRVFKPQKKYLKLITLGEKRACADKYRFCFHGRLLWKLKDYIDQSFMKQFN